MSYDIPQCHHLHSTGLRCGSPALKSHQFCYNHNQAHIPSIDPKNSEAFIPLLESGESIQLATTNILRALAADRLSEKKAYAMFFGIQQLGLAFRHLQKPVASFIETEIQPGMQRVLDHDTSDLDRLTHAQRLHAKGFDADYGTLENPLPFSTTIEHPDEIAGCWVDIPITKIKPRSETSGTGLPACAEADTSKKLPSTTTAQNQVILTANQVSRKDLCIPADTTNAADKNNRSHYRGPDVPIPRAAKMPPVSVRLDRASSPNTDGSRSPSSDTTAEPNRPLPLPDGPLSPDLSHIDPYDLTHAECRYASQHTCCKTYDDNVVRSYLVTMRESNPEGYSKVIDGARRLIAKRGTDWLEEMEDVS